MLALFISHSGLTWQTLLEFRAMGFSNLYLKPQILFLHDIIPLRSDVSRFLFGEYKF